MWGTKMRLNLTLAAAAAALVAATPAVAQQATTTQPAEARGIVLQSLTLSKISDLDFGTVAGSNTIGGNVVVDADTGARTGNQITLMPGTVSRARFDGFGVPGNTVVLALTPPAGGVLTNGGGVTLHINSMSLDNGNLLTRTIGATGQFTVYVGGDFQIAAAQANGLYTGNFNLTAVYQ
jgi:hypothetical protein